MTDKQSDNFVIKSYELLVRCESYIYIDFSGNM